jgi:mitotic-spindle organizing protein 1
MPGPTAEQDKRKAARETVDILHEISTLLVGALHHRSAGASYVVYVLLTIARLSVTVQNTQLDRNVLAHCVSLIENGVNPEALAVSTVRLLVTSRAR